MKLGLLGGTFDPPHKAHLAMARTALGWGCDQVRLIPAATPPHKQFPALTDPWSRFAMCELAALREPGVVVDPRELQAAGVSFTIDTLCSIREELPETELFLLVGLDNWHTIGSWHRIAEFPGLVRFMVFGRDRTSHPANIPAGVATGAVLFPEFGLDIASTAIREAIAYGDADWAEQVPPLVGEYILKRGLYGVPLTQSGEAAATFRGDE